MSLHRNRQGGGIKIFYMENIEVTTVSELTGIFDSREQVFIKEVVPGVGPITFGTIYRPPAKSVPNFCEDFRTTLETVQNKRCIIVGDQNINTLNYQHDVNMRLYEDLFNEFGFYNEIDKPTFFSPITNTAISCLDHVFTNLNYPKKSFVVEPPLADHFGTCVTFVNKVKNILNKERFRDYSSRNTDRFRENLDIEFRNFRSPQTHANEKALYLQKFLQDLLDKYFPVRIKYISTKRLNSPWMTTEILRCIDKKHRWFRLSKNGVITRECYNKLAKDVRKLLKCAEEDYYVGKL